MEETYKAERNVAVLSIILVIIIIFTMLSFFGIIGDGPKASYGCKLPKHFQCEKLIITTTTIDFDVTYPIAALEQLNFKPAADSTCTEALTNGMEAGNKMHISIRCGSTGIKDQVYRLEFEVSYLPEKKLEQIEQGSLKGKVT